MRARRILKAVGYAVLTELALTGISALSFFVVGWYAVLLYGIVHPALFIFYFVERTKVDSMWDSVFRHATLLALLNALVFSFVWYYWLRKREAKC